MVHIAVKNLTLKTLLNRSFQNSVRSIDRNILQYVK